MDGDAWSYQEVVGHGFTQEDGGAFFYVDYMSDGFKLRALLAAHKLKRYSESTQVEDSAEETLTVFED